jgi:hypothetical protein
VNDPREMVRGGDVRAAARDLNEVRYCTRCDLGFCGRHEGVHRAAPFNCVRELITWPGHIASPFCAVCSGVVRA